MGTTGCLGLFVLCMLVCMAYPSTLANAAWKGYVDVSNEKGSQYPTQFNDDARQVTSNIDIAKYILFKHRSCTS